MKKEIACICASLLLATTAVSAPLTPAPGDPLRSAVLDVVRTVAGLDLGGPLELVVTQLFVDEDRALVLLTAQRPGGVQIDMTQIPMVKRDEIPLWAIDGPTVEAFLYRADGKWYVDAYAVGATDVWWAGGPYCADYASLLNAQMCP